MFYTVRGDYFDADGHGTSCGASIAGSLLSHMDDLETNHTLGLATGVAPAAQLSVMDFQISSRIGYGLSVPDRVDLEYLPVSCST